ncbi:MULTISPECIES: nitrous oxide reductase family maturation protein NosD [Ensifer]|uniref:nitrous oxide reductase family maturation protein NosD n=1 Tax=Ensifer TaxID=106591 RepID=UPI000713DCCB|nr:MULTISPECIES: nitrous oxide reductase family maturation protein NosD [Ensifer]KQZ42113.1 carbohydrate-binding protein [Ensifer sp. Root558]MBD9594818.1 nitrous oxide reductase family maturation protein NosD [Ensifer sp. ENS05]MBD9628381.1 nitrous oxide reductase family maturation protein NosD [Ensifer sp. ENS06]MBW0367008.1 nitrous oxide reductase family maturation protein NosD [Ensifer adhaerens]UCM24648.1 nitrous oxide reductase family maturation protein NosD [Ensifer adhaerens]
MRLSVLLIGFLLASPLLAAERAVVPGAGSLAAAIAGAQPGDVLVLTDGAYDGPVTIDRPLTITGPRGAVVNGLKQGSVVTIAASDVTLTGFTVTGSGRINQDLDAGVKIVQGADRARVEKLLVTDNMHGIDVHGGRDTIVSGNEITGTRSARMNERGNGIYVWNSPGTLLQDNIIRYGRDGIFSNASADSIYRRNIMRDLRFAVHFMYTRNTEVSDNISIGNHLGFAIMFSNRAKILNNLSLGDREHGLMLNYANNADVSGNLVRGGTKKCLFIYNAHKNLVWGNRFESCGIGIHFTAGSEKNVLTGNAFIANREQVKYVGTRNMEWSHEGRGNFWSDHPAFDLNGDGIADSFYRPNDLMDQILWSQPAASLLTGSPAVQIVRWSQRDFPATLPGGVRDSAPLMRPLTIPVPLEILAYEAEAAGRWTEGNYDDTDVDNLQAH